MGGVKPASPSLGKVTYDRNAWYGMLDYEPQMPPKNENSLPTWMPGSRRLSPFGRTREAMVALEREATFLKNHHGKDILIGDHPWARA